MAGANIDRHLLEAHMKLHNVKLKDLAAAQKPRPWSITTAYRKVNGERAFTAPEIQACVKLLSLDPETASKIFLLTVCLKRHTMDAKRQARLDALVDPEAAKERVMMERILDDARKFYANPDNVRAFEAWQKEQREEAKHAANYSDP